MVITVENKKRGDSAQIDSSDLATWAFYGYDMDEASASAMADAAAAGKAEADRIAAASKPVKKGRPAAGADAPDSAGG